MSGYFLTLGGSVASYVQYGPMYTLTGGYSSPTNLASGLAETVVVGAAPYSSGVINTPVKKATKQLARLNLQQPRLLYGEDFVGRLRGVVYDDVLRGAYGWEEHLKALGLSGLDFNDRGKLVLIEGHNYAFARSDNGNSILTDNPTFW